MRVLKENERKFYSKPQEEKPQIEAKRDDLTPKLVESIQAIKEVHMSLGEVSRGFLDNQQGIKELLDYIVNPPKRAYSCSLGRGSDGKIKSIEIAEQ